MRVFVAGAGGFIGGAVTALLERYGHEVTAHVRSRDGDVRAGSVPRGTDLVVNSAGRLGGAGVDESALDEGNTAPARVLAGEASRLGIPIVHLGTPGVTGLAAGASEDLPPAPWGPYERSKARAEEVLRSIVPEGMLTILRPDFVYGPGDFHKAALFRQAAKGWFPMVGMGGARIRPTFVLDVARACIEAMPGGRLEGGVFNIGGPEVVTVSELVAAVGRALGRRVLRVPVPRAAFRAAIAIGLFGRVLSESRYMLFGRDHFVSIEKASSAGFTSCTGLASGLASTVTWLRSEGLVP
ncbi:NAD-dependent epimerase/dehydratase family protein [Candidatus Fermentibacteria bacterium]|nr:NAD-dependent epimerase/dehydratase family protein [Candidatus Fermentibacteria bacterium]